MNLRVSNINYQIAQDETTTSITTTVSGNEGGNYISATIMIVAADLPSGTESLDDLTRKNIQKIALGKLQTLVSQNSPTSPSK